MFDPHEGERSRFDQSFAESKNDRDEDNSRDHPGRGDCEGADGDCNDDTNVGGSGSETCEHISSHNGL